MRVFKIMRAAESQEFTAARQWAGSTLDRRDGFIHLSADHQVADTAARHYPAGSGSDDAPLMLAAFDAAALGPALRWEPSRDDATFPHLHGALPRSAMRASWPLAEWLVVGVRPGA